MKYSMLSFFTLLFFSISALSQTVVVRGIVKSAVTGEGLCYVHIAVASTGLGTITNSKGQFSLEIPSILQNKTLSISYVGYKSRSIKVSECKGAMSIVLEKTDIYIDEVFITQENFLHRILRRAFDSIPKNYPDKATEYIGFYKESLMTVDSLYLYVSEAKLQIYKNPYSKTDRFGQVKLLESKKYQNPLEDTINIVKFYGGAYAFQWLDVVNERSDFINPRKYDNFNYTLVGISKSNSSETYIIRFDRKDVSKGKLAGKIYIDKKTLAYTYFEYEGIDDKFETFALKKKDFKRMVGYTYFKGKWHLNYGVHERYYVNMISKANLIGQVLYHTKEIIADSVKPIPYDEQFLFTDIFVDKANLNGQISWNGRNNILDDPKFIAQLNKTVNIDNLKEKEKVKFIGYHKFLKYLEKISVSYFLEYSSIRTPLSSYHLVFEPNQALVLETNKEIKSNEFYLNYGYRINYLWSRRLFSFIEAKNYYNDRALNNSYRLGLTYNARIKNSGRPIYFRSSAAFDINNIGAYSGDFTSNESFKFGGKKFDSKNISSYLGYNRLGITPEIEFSTPISKFIQLFISGSYFLEIKRSRILYIMENSNSLFDKKAKGDLNSSKINLTIDGIQTTNPNIRYSNFQFKIGILFGVNIN